MLIDTSAWVEFFHHPDGKHALFIDDLLATGEAIHTCPIIYLEVLRGIRHDKEFRRVRSNFSTYHFLLFSDSITAAEEAATLYRQCRKKGITVRKANDCLIAHYALHFNVPLLHYDSDFNQIAKVFPLQIVSV